MDDLGAIEAYSDAFAVTVPRLVLTLTQVAVQMQMQDEQEQVVLWVDVRETPELRALHERLNAELAHHFAETSAPFDGPAYHFHATVALATMPAGAQQQMRAASATWRVDLSCVPSAVALFYCDDDRGTPGSYITYKVAPLGPSASTG
jgi:2'-5' RNA ligase